MALGPGKYDDICTMVREKAQAESAIVIVIDGNRGSGFSCQATFEALMHLPDMLERLAQQIREGSQ